MFLSLHVFTELASCHFVHIVSRVNQTLWFFVNFSHRSKNFLSVCSYSCFSLYICLSDDRYCARLFLCVKYFCGCASSPLLFLHVAAVAVSLLQQLQNSLAAAKLTMGLVCVGAVDHIRRYFCEWGSLPFFRDHTSVYICCTYMQLSLVVFIWQLVLHLCGWISVTHCAVLPGNFFPRMSSIISCYLVVFIDFLICLLK